MGLMLLKGVISETNQPFNSSPLLLSKLHLCYFPPPQHYMLKNPKLQVISHKTTCFFQTVCFFSYCSFCFLLRLLKYPHVSKINLNSNCSMKSSPFPQVPLVFLPFMLFRTICSVFCGRIYYVVL